LYVSLTYKTLESPEGDFVHRRAKSPSGDLGVLRAVGYYVPDLILRIMDIDRKACLAGNPVGTKKSRETKGRRGFSVLTEK
jgi:hypothetical protein